MATRALVLGSGGLSGIAWEVGVLQALAEAGLDITAWDLVVGTSAGSFVGARLLGEGSVDTLAAGQSAATSAAVESSVGRVTGRMLIRILRLGRARRFGWLPRAWVVWVGLSAIARYTARRGIRAAGRLGPALRVGQQGADTSPAVLRQVGAVALCARTRGEEAWLAYWARSLEPVHEWPATRLLMVSIDAADGARQSWDQSAGVPLVRAVAASTAVPLVVAPITIDERRYFDGGGGSQTNADLARGCDEVLIVAPVDRGRLAGEVDGLRAAGSQVVVIRPSSGSRAQLGADITTLDPGRRAMSFLAGLADGSKAGPPMWG